MYSEQTGAVRLRLVAAAAALVVMAASVGALVTSSVRAQVPENRSAAIRNQAPPLNPARVAPLAGLQDAFTAIADRVEPSLVSIRVKKSVRSAALGDDDMFRGFQFMFPDSPGMRMPRTMPRQFNQLGAGSGVIVRSDGWVLTNDHVVAGADSVTVKLYDGREFDGKVRRDYRSDLAVVKINATGLTPVEFGDSDRVRVGQWAIAFGSPFELDNTMTVGIISARSRQKQISEGGQSRFYPVLLQTDASINPGNSGGPLVDIQGRLIAINVAINSPSGGSVGIGFAIPSNAARDIVSQLIDKGSVTRGFLGVGPTSLSPTDRERYGVPKGGALIGSVSENTPASRAGIQVEDVILSVNGKPVEDDAQFRSLIAAIAPGRSAELTIRRNGREMKVTATLEAPRAEAAAGERPAGPSAPDGGRIGLRTEALTPENSRQYNLQGVSGGLIVTEVQGGGAADEAGLEPGDVILRANGKSVRTPEDLAGIVSAAKSGDTIRLVVTRRDRSDQGQSARVLVSVHVP